MTLGYESEFLRDLVVQAAPERHLSLWLRDRSGARTSLDVAFGDLGTAGDDGRSRRDRCHFHAYIAVPVVPALFAGFGAQRRVANFPTWGASFDCTDAHHDHRGCDVLLRLRSHALFLFHR